MRNYALIVVAKEPAPGSTKTRLCPPLTPTGAAEFYEHLLMDSLDLANRVHGVDRILAYTPTGSRPYFQELAPDGFDLAAQVGADLGERLANALSQCFVLGYRRVVIMNSDGPTLPREYLEQAFAGLDGADVTLGPGHDGGYYLIGMKRFEPELFRGIAWSTERVVSQTLALCDGLGLGVHLLPEWYDVDVRADLERLRADLERNPDWAPRTWRFLQRVTGEPGQGQQAGFASKKP